MTFKTFKWHSAPQIHTQQVKSNNKRLYFFDHLKADLTESSVNHLSILIHEINDFPLATSQIRDINYAHFKRGDSKPRSFTH